MNELLEVKYNNLKEKYLNKIASDLEDYLSSILDGIERIDRIITRAKSTERFIKKSSKLDENNKLKYTDPLNQIQDQIGARIITFYKSDIQRINIIIKDYFRHIEKTKMIPDSVNEFGYEGLHYIMFIPDDLMPNHSEDEIIPHFFELQIKTLYQHAWSEANHDICYKASSELPLDDKRKVAFTAAQSWGADHIFDELYKNSAQ